METKNAPRRGTSPSAHTVAPTDDLPTTNAAMMRLVKLLAPDAIHVGLGMVSAVGDAGKLSVWVDGPNRWAYDLTEYGVDEEDEPDDTMSSGHVMDRKHLSRLLGVVLGLRAATDYADDPEAYLRDRTRSGVPHA